MHEFFNEQVQEDSEEQEQEDLLDLNEVMRSFGIDKWTNLGPLEPSHTENLSLLVDVQGQRYVLRERPEGLMGEDLQHRYDFQQYLKRAGIPVPDLKLTLQGEPAATFGEDSFELQQWMAGEHFNTSDRRNLNWVEAAGTMLGRIHQAARRYSGHQHSWPSETHIGAVVQSYLNLARSKSDEITVLAVASALANWADQWEAVLPAAMMAIGAGKSSLPEFHIHGDYHALNLRFNDTGVTAVMGLEASRWEKRIFEVAYGLFYFSALQWKPDESLTRPLVKRGFEPERARHFLQAYAEVYLPVRGEATLLGDVLSLVAPIATINGPLEDLFYVQEELDETLIEDVMERLSWAASLPAWLARVRRSLAEMWG
ncbi:MAG: phosphotransferase [Ktedonobacteraceae bacterium]|nr:phosphotransferase [Ktedonobacteraceae bacterium]